MIFKLFGGEREREREEKGMEWKENQILEAHRFLRLKRIVGSNDECFL